jgi:hypothetical protein
VRDDDMTWRRRTILRAAGLALVLGGVVGLPASPAQAVPISPAPTPTLTGDPRPGQNLFIAPGEWPADTTLAYEWLLDGVKEPGANGPAWTVRQVDIDVVFQVAVTGSKAEYDDVRMVSAPVTIVGEQQVLRPTPAVVGAPRFGDTLTATPGAWDAGTTQTYAWLRAGSPIAEATGTAYTPTLADLGFPLSFRVTSTRPGYSKVVSTSAATAAVGSATLPAGSAAVTGSAQVGQRLNAAVTGWDSSVSVTYQWLRSGTPIAGATGASYAVPVADLGAPISVRATGAKAGFSTVSVTSAPTAGVAAGTQTRGKVRISGAPKVGRTLKARPAGFDAGTMVSYRWLVGGKVRGTKPSLKLTGKMAGKRVVLQVVVTRPGYETLTVASKATGKVKAVKKPKKKRAGRG